MTLTKNQQTLADLLFEVGAVKFGAFTLKAHEKNPDLPLSPVYLNLRTADHPTKKDGPLTPAIMELVGKEFNRIIGSLNPFHCFVDIPDAGKPFGDQFGYFVDKSVERLVLTKCFCDDGTRYISDEVQGACSPGQVCVVIDELITQADSKLEAVSVLRDHGLYVEDVVVLVDRCQGGAEELNRQGCRLHTALTLPDMLTYYMQTGKISESKANEVRAYLVANSI